MSISMRQAFLFIGLIFTLALAVWLASLLPSADWLSIYDATTRHMLNGGNPYDKLYDDCDYCVFVNPPWTLIILIPFTLLPPDLSRGLIFVVSIISIIYYGWRIRASAISIGILIISPTVIGMLLAGNLDALIFSAIFLPPAWALLILMIKPQIGLGVAIFYAVINLKERKWVALIRTFTPIIIAYLLSFLLFPDWLRTLLEMPENPWNRSVFPYGILFGIAFLGFGIFRGNPFFAMAASPFLSPYLTFYSYSVVQFGLLTQEVEKVISRNLLQIFMAIILWFIMLYFRL
jgi:hypothetical protein